MGAALSVDECPLAVAAVAEITQFDLEQLRALCAACQGVEGDAKHQEEGRDAHDDHEQDASHDPNQGHVVDAANAHSDLEHPTDLSWAAFLHALDVAKFAASDRAILERMFTLMDKTGDELVSCRELLVGACVLLQGDLASKLQAAVEIHRTSASESHDRRPSVSPASHEPSHDALLFILSAFATVASFFGDPLLKKTALSKAVHDMFDSREGSLSSGDKLRSTDTVLQGLAHHPIVERYIHQLAVDAESHAAA